MPLLVRLAAIAVTIYVAYLASHVLMIALLFAVPAMAAGAVALEVASREQARRLASRGHGASLICASFVPYIDLDKGSIILKWKQERPTIAETVKTLLPQSHHLAVAYIFSVVTYAAEVLAGIVNHPSILNSEVVSLDENAIPNIRLVVAVIIIAPFVVWFALLQLHRYYAPLIFVRSAMRQANIYKKLSRATVSPSMKDLSRLIGEIERAAMWTGSLFPTDADARIGSVVERLKIDVLRNPQRLEELIKDACRRCSADLTHLEGARTVYLKANLAFEEAKIEVLRAGSDILLKRLDAVRERIDSRHLLGRVPRRQWSDFHEIVRDMTAEIDAVMEEARHLNVVSGKAQTPTTLIEIITSVTSRNIWVCHHCGNNNSASGLCEACGAPEKYSSVRRGRKPGGPPFFLVDGGDASH